MLEFSPFSKKSNTLKTKTDMRNFTEKEIQMIGKAAREFAVKVLLPAKEENERYPFAPFFKRMLKQAYELDFFHITLPERLEGLEYGINALCLALENICREDASLGGIIFAQTAAQEIMLQAADESELKDAFVQDSAEKMLTAFPAFNDPSEIQPETRAVKKGEKYYVNGKLDYVVNAGIAGRALVPAVIDRDPGYSFFLAPLPDETVLRSPPALSLGLRACPVADLEFRETEAALIGLPGKGDEYFRAMSAKIHVAAAAMSLGIMRGAYDEALQYAEKRRQGGRTIVEWSEVRMILSEMLVKVQAADMIVKQASQAVDRCDKGWEHYSVAAAIHVQNMACDLTSDGVQVLGGVGYMKDFGQEKRFRDAQHLQALLGLTPIKKLRLFQNVHNYKRQTYYNSEAGLT